MTYDARIRMVVRGIIWAVLAALIVWQGVVISRTQTQVREANDRLFRVVHGSPTCTVMCDEWGKIVEYNRAAEEMFGWHRPEVIGRPVDMLIAPEGREEHARVFASAVEQLRVIDEDWRITKNNIKGLALGRDGSKFRIVFTTRGIRFGGRIEFLAEIKRDSPAPKMEEGPLKLPAKEKLG